MPEVNAGTLENVARVVQNYTRCVESETKTTGLLIQSVNEMRRALGLLIAMNFITLVTLLLYLLSQ